jgi:tetratricopeptide (TPR) repeat protein
MAYLQRGIDYATNGEPVEATLEFRNALRLNADLVDAQLGLAQALEQQGDFNNAAKSYLAVTEQSADNVLARVRLSYILLAAGQIDQAVKFADEANAIAPGSAAVLVARAAIAMRQGDSPSAVTLAKEALTLEPENTDALVVLASERLLGSDPAGALMFLDQVSSLGERDIGIQTLRLTALEAMGDEPGVEELFKKLITLFPDVPSIREGLTGWYLGKDRKDDAEAVVRQFVADNANDEQAALSLISFLYAQRGPDAAASELEGLIEARNNSAEAYTFRQALAQLRYQSGATDTAIGLMQALVADTADSTLKNQARAQLASMLITNEPSEAMALIDAVLAEDERNVDALGLRASIRLADGEFEAASQDLVAALNEAPDNANLHGLLAQAYEATGSAALAQEQYAKAAEISGYTPDAGVPMARFFLRYGKSDQALRVLEAVRSRTPDNREVLGMLAELRLSAQDWAGAQEIADTLRTLGSDGGAATADRIGAAALIGLNRFNESIDLLQGVLLNGASRDQILPDLIGAYVRSGKPEAAEAYLNDILGQNPDDAEARILLGSVHMVQGKTDLAETEFKSAADNPDSRGGDIALAQFYWTTGNLEAAEQAAKAGLEESPDSVPLGRFLAAIYERSERFDDAIAQYELLLERDPSSAVTANDLASLLSDRRTDAESLARAYEIAQRLVGSEIPQYLDTLGWIYHLRGDQAAALPLLKSAAERLPNVGLVHFHLGQVLRELGQLDAARVSFEQALAVNPPLLAADRVKVEQALETLEVGNSAEQTAT